MDRPRHILDIKVTVLIIVWDVQNREKRILKVSPTVFDLNNYVMGEVIYRELG